MNKLIISAACVLLSAPAFAQSRNVEIDYDPGLSPITPAGPSAGFDVLYAPSESDDPAFRAAIAAFVGGNVDYMDPRAATPTLQELQDYECVMTWANFGYADNVAFGDNLAAYVDAGGSVVLGAFAAYTSGNFLSGAVMGPDYSPVTGGLNHFTDLAYAGDGATPIYDGVTTFSATYRDILTLQGAGTQDGSYLDGEIAAAYQPGVAVIYANGATGLPLDGNDEDQPRLVANACMLGANVEQITVARFHVTKAFSDSSTDEVEVALTCTTGLPLHQTATIAGGDPVGVTFVVTDLEGAVNCEVTETSGPGNYTPVFNGGSGCAWIDSVQAFNTCEIGNLANDARFTAYKEWVITNEGGDEVNTLVPLAITCDNPITASNGTIGSCGPDCYRATRVVDDGGYLMADVSTLDGPAWCGASESITQSGVDSVDDCDSRFLTAGSSDSCTFVNTVFFEGIPTLSQYGLALLALLMLGVGMVGFRRFA